MSDAAIQHMQRVVSACMTSPGAMTATELKREFKECTGLVTELKREFKECTRGLEAEQKKEVTNVVGQEIVMGRYLLALRAVQDGRSLLRIAFFLSKKHRQPVPSYDVEHAKTSAICHEVMHLYKKLKALTEAEVAVGVVMVSRMTRSTLAGDASGPRASTAVSKKSNIAHRRPLQNVSSKAAVTAVSSARPKGIYVQEPKRCR